MSAFTYRFSGEVAELEAALAAATARAEREGERARQYRAAIEDIYATVIQFGVLPMTEEARQIVASFCRLALDKDASTRHSPMRHEIAEDGAYAALASLRAAIAEAQHHVAAGDDMAALDTLQIALSVPPDEWGRRAEAGTRVIAAARAVLAEASSPHSRTPYTPQMVKLENAFAVYDGGAGMGEGEE